MKKTNERPSLDKLCSFIVGSADELRKLKDILRKAPVTLAEGLGEDAGYEHLAYFAEPSYVLALAGQELEKEMAGIEHAVEILVDAACKIPREYENARDCCWDVHDNKGKSCIHTDHIIPLAEGLDSRFIPEANMVLVVYNEGDKRYMIGFSLFDKEMFETVNRPEKEK